MPSLLRRWFEPALILLAAGYLILLPFSRSAEAVLLVLAVLGPVCWWRYRYHAGFRQGLQCLSWLYIAFALPMFLSSVDSYAADKSWLQSVASLRFYLAGITLLALFADARRQRHLLMVLAVVVLFWAVDAVIQFLLGYNLLGYPASSERLGGVFGSNIWFFGPMLAMLSPLALEWLWRQPRRWLAIVGFVLIPAAVLLSGMRAGWLLLPVIGAVYGWRLIRKQGFAGWRIILLAIIVSGLLGWVVVQQSPLVQQRIQQTLTIDFTDEANLQQVLSERWLIWQASAKMVQAHPVNGVGVRAFPEAYPAFSTPDDPQIIKHGGDRGARHAHHLWLESLTDCGLPGLVGLLLIGWLLFRRWRAASSEQRELAWPYLFCLMLIFFPFNTHFSLYGTFLSSTIWWLMGLALAALFIHEDKPEHAGD